MTSRFINVQSMKYKALRWFIYLGFLPLISCGQSAKELKKSIDIQGHRGCRGLYPENSLVGMLHALSLGVNTLEMDVVITKDRQVVLSHEPFLSHEICLDTFGQEISEKRERSWNIYQMTYEELKKCDCGGKTHPRFAEQKKVFVEKPLLSRVLRDCRYHTAPYLKYNIEIKSSSGGDGVFHPAVDTFVALVLSEIRRAGLDSLCVIQSFDVRALEAVHQQNPSIKTALLVENIWGIEKNLRAISFTPTIYSPDFNLINQDSVRRLQSKGIQVIPWTVNEVEDIKRVLSFGVDGIISDYPDRVLQVVK